MRQKKNVLFTACISQRYLAISEAVVGSRRYISNIQMSNGIDAQILEIPT
jgi:hypothetical protein